MTNISMLPVIFREILGDPEFPREPEPNLIMADEDQVIAYEKAGRTDGVMSASYLFHAARISQVIQGSQQVIDLACGPATQLALVAELNPEISFLGIDFSETMLVRATAYVKEKGLTNVFFQKGDISNLEHIATNDWDGVTSTMALHHLPSLKHLERCFKEINRIKKPDGCLYLVDFGRLKYLKSVLYFAYMNRKYQPHIFSLDYERSLRASFVKKEFQKLRNTYLSEYELISTFLVPLLIIIKSPDKKIDKNTISLIKKQRINLPKKYRKILDDMRLFLRLSGLENDPFK